MKTYTVEICCVDRQTADKLYKMALSMGAEVTVEEDEEKPQPKGVMAAVAGED